MAPPPGVFGNTGSHPSDHVEPTVPQILHQKQHFGGFLSFVTIGHHVYVGFNVGKYAAHRVSLPKSRFKPDHRSGFKGPGHRLVDKSVVVDGGFRKRRAEPGDNATDGAFFIPVGNQNSNSEVGSVHRVIGRSPR